MTRGRLQTALERKRIFGRLKRKACILLACLITAVSGSAALADLQTQTAQETQSPAESQPQTGGTEGTAQTASANTVHRASSLAKAKKKKLSGITKIKKNYYYLRNGRPVRSKKGKVVREGERLLFVESSGQLVKGWHKLGKKLYYSGKMGVIRKGVTVNGIKINQEGYAKATAANVRKVIGDRLAEKSARVAASVAGSVSGRGAKLRAIWNFMSSRSNFRYIRTYETFSPSTARSRALAMLTGRGGNCYDFALAFAALARAIGYDAYMIYGLCPAAGGGMTTHGWTYLRGAGYFDVEANFAGWATGVYGYADNPYVEHGRVKM